MSTYIKTQKAKVKVSAQLKYQLFICLVLIYKGFCCLLQKASRFVPSFPKFSLVLLNTTHKESDVKINNVGGVTHDRNLSRFYLHKQSLETPTHVGTSSHLESILLALWRCFFKI